MPLNQRRDFDAGLPEATEFMVLMPEAIAEDEDRCFSIVDRLEAAFPGLTFKPMRCERLRNPEGREIEIDELAAIPLMGGAGEGSKLSSYRRRPSVERIREINEALRTLAAGPANLN